ncbi:MAG: hypothetical protein DRP02_12350 [Candidatus Gerdarchaeota archaeon]|nr:MAG: hypothetical protein DRP02_12350 [Candidatus Gerdarchaeota archaeon]
MEISTLYPLYDDWKPPILLERQQELNEMLTRTALTNFPRNLWIQGTKGQGKTLTAHIFMDEIQARQVGKCFYVQCAPTFKQTLRNFCRKYNLAVPQYSLNTTQVLHSLASAKEFEQAKRIILILDDIDKLHHKNLLDGFAFQAYETLSDCHKQFSLIFITRSSFLNRSRYFQEDTQSRLQLFPILFKAYNAFQLEKIIRQRIDLVLSPNQYTQGAIRRLAALMTRIGADMRKTLEILRNAIQIAEKVLDEKAIEQAWLSEKRRFWKEQLMQLPPHQALLLVIISQLQTRYDTITTNLILNHYHDFCKKFRVDPLSKRMVYFTIDNLENMGYIDRKRGSRLENYITLTENPKNILDASTEINWEELLVFRTVSPQQPSL